jgi:hypothetical protein
VRLREGITRNHRELCPHFNSHIAERHPLGNTHVGNGLTVIFNGSIDRTSRGDRLKYRQNNIFCSNAGWHASRQFDFDAFRDSKPQLTFRPEVGHLSSANAALDGGAAFLEGAICGIGGGIAMPESLGSVGNYPAEDLVRMLELLQIKTGLNVERVTQASKEIAALLEISPRSHSALDYTREAVMQWGKDHPREHPA